MYSSIKSLVVTVCTVATVAGVAVVPLAPDFRTPEWSDDPAVGNGNTAVPAVVDGTSGQKVDGVPRAEGLTPAGTEPVAAALEPAPDDASSVVSDSPASTGAAWVPETIIGAPTPSPSVPSHVPMTPTVAFVGPIAAAQVAAEPGSEEIDAATSAEPALTDDGLGSGMGGDLPPEVLPTPSYPQCPITAAGAWWTDPADPYTCIPPDSIPFHEPTPPGLPPELLEPIVENSETPEGSVGWFEPTPPGIDPALLEPILEDVGQAGAGEE